MAQCTDKLKEFSVLFFPQVFSPYFELPIALFYDRGKCPYT